MKPVDKIKEGLEDVAGDKMTKKPISELVIELENATAHHLEMSARADRARGEATEALNAVNNAQKRLDEAMNELRKNAHHATDWKFKERP